MMDSTACAAFQNVLQIEKIFGGLDSICFHMNNKTLPVFFQEGWDLYCFMTAWAEAGVSAPFRALFRK